jgi:plastocyanin
MKKTPIYGLLVIMVLFVAGLVTPAAAQAAGTDAVTPQTYTVLIGAEDIAHGISAETFFPETLYVHPGDTVLWKLNTAEIHTVTFLAGAPVPPLTVQFPLGPVGAQMLNPEVAFPVIPTGGYDGSTIANSGIMGPDPGQPTQFSLTFTNKGPFGYVCVVHAEMGMNGRIVVVDKSVHIPSPQQVTHQANNLIKAKLASGRALYNKALASVPSPVRNPDGTKTYFVLVGYNKGQIDLMDFFPKKLTVHQGDTVKWQFSSSDMDPHTISFLNGAPEPGLVLPVDNPAGGPPFLVINPALALPSNADQPLTRTGYYNSGFIDPHAPGPHSFSLVVGNFEGSISYECLLHDESGMLGSLKVLDR